MNTGSGNSNKSSSVASKAAQFTKPTAVTAATNGTGAGTGATTTPLTIGNQLPITTTFSARAKFNSIASSGDIINKTNSKSTAGTGAGAGIGSAASSLPEKASPLSLATATATPIKSNIDSSVVKVITAPKTNNTIKPVTTSVTNAGSVASTASSTAVKSPIAIKPTTPATATATATSPPTINNSFANKSTNAFKSVNSPVSISASASASAASSTVSNGVNKTNSTSYKDNTTVKSSSSVPAVTSTIVNGNRDSSSINRNNGDKSPVNTGESKVNIPKFNNSTLKPAKVSPPTSLPNSEPILAVTAAGAIAAALVSNNNNNINGSTSSTNHNRVPSKSAIEPPTNSKVTFLKDEPVKSTVTPITTAITNTTASPTVNKFKSGSVAVDRSTPSTSAGTQATGRVAAVSASLAASPVGSVAARAALYANSKTNSKPSVSIPASVASSSSSPITVPATQSAPVSVIGFKAALANANAQSGTGSSVNTLKSHIKTSSADPPSSTVNKNSSFSASAVNHSRTNSSEPSRVKSPSQSQSQQQFQSQSQSQSQQLDKLEENQSDESPTATELPSVVMVESQSEQSSAISDNNPNSNQPKVSLGHNRHETIPFAPQPPSDRSSVVAEIPKKIIQSAPVSVSASSDEPDQQSQSISQSSINPYNSVLDDDSNTDRPQSPPGPALPPKKAPNKRVGIEQAPPTTIPTVAAVTAAPVPTSANVIDTTATRELPSPPKVPFRTLPPPIPIGLTIKKDDNNENKSTSYESAPLPQSRLPPPGPSNNNNSNPSKGSFGPPKPASGLPVGVIPGPRPPPPRAGLNFSVPASVSASILAAAVAPPPNRPPTIPRPFPRPTGTAAAAAASSGAGAGNRPPPPVAVRPSKIMIWNTNKLANLAKPPSTPPAATTDTFAAAPLAVKKYSFDDNSVGTSRDAYLNSAHKLAQTLATVSISEIEEQAESYMNKVAKLGKLTIVNPAAVESRARALSPAVKKSTTNTTVTSVVRLGHVHYDPTSGKFSGLPKEWEDALKQKFGLPIGMQSETTALTAYRSRIPTLLIYLQQLLYKLDGLQSEGIFRISAETTAVETAKNILNNGGSINDCIDPNIASNLIKYWFRELPAPLLHSVDRDLLARCNSIQQTAVLIENISEPSQSVLLWLLDLCCDVTSNSGINKMTRKPISIVLAPNLYRCPKPASQAKTSAEAAQQTAQFVGLMKSYTGFLELAIEMRETQREHQRLTIKQYKK